MNDRTRLRLWTTFILLQIVVFNFIVSAQQIHKSSDLVAVVNDNKITYGQIQVGDDSLRAVFHMRHGKYPQTSNDQKEIDQDKSKREEQELTGAIRSSIREEKIKALGITVTDQEVLERQHEIYKNTTRQDLIARRAKLRPLIDALKAVQSGKMTEKDAYQKFLAPPMSYDEWLIQTDTYANPVMMKSLEDFANQTVEDIRSKPDEGVRITLTAEKLKHAIDTELAATNKDYRAYIDAEESNDQAKVEAIMSHQPDLVKKQHQAWWVKQYQSANINIVDSHFAGAKRLLLETKP